MTYYLMFKRINIEQFNDCTDPFILFKAIYELIRPGTFDVSKKYLDYAEYYYGGNEWNFINRFVVDQNIVFKNINGVIVICK